MRLVNAYTINPEDVRVGDVMLFTVKAIALRRDADDKIRYRIYRCEWPGTKCSEVPQGSQIANMEEVAEALFPSLALIGEPG